jgi:hypothetical protein
MSQLDARGSFCRRKIELVQAALGHSSVAKGSAQGNAL